MEPPKSKRARTEITFRDKKDICLYKKEHPNASQDSIAQHFSHKLSKHIGRSTISEILCDQERWVNTTEDSGNSIRKRAPKFEELETCLYTWFAQARNKQAIICDEILIEKAKFFGKKLEIPEEFAYSRGWIANFKSRYNISMHKISGEAEGADKHAVVSGRAELQKKLAAFDPDDLYNFDESGVFYRLPPDSTLATNSVSGSKKQKDRITVGVLTNSTGSYKGKLLVIGKAARPRCFGKQFDPNSVVSYRHNSTAWMTSKEFTDYLRTLDKQMQQQQRKILLLVDNCASHKLLDLELQSIELHFLPPNTTSHLQPLDAGIIQNLKVHYRKRLVQYYIHCVDSDMRMTIDIKTAIQFLASAWNAVTPNSIANCWRHTGILPVHYFGDAAATSDEETRVPNPALSELAELLHDIRIEPANLLTASQYITVDSELPHCPEMSDDEILDTITHPKVIENADVSITARMEVDPDDIDSPTVSTHEALTAIRTLLQYIEQHPDNSAEITHLTSIQEKILGENALAKRQPSITDFFHRI